MPTKSNKREEIGNLSEKEFRLMIIKMIQNLESKMELQRDKEGEDARNV